jgi:hypothetical protein
VAMDINGPSMWWVKTGGHEDGGDGEESENGDDCDNELSSQTVKEEST